MKSNFFDLYKHHPVEIKDLAEKIYDHIIKRSLNVDSIIPWRNKFEIVIPIKYKKRVIFEIDAYDQYKKIGELGYFKELDEILSNKVFTRFVLQETKEKELLSVTNTFYEYINSSKYLKTINSHRSRNFILYYNDALKIVYDIREKELLFEPKITFSRIEHDTNRKFTERVCVDLLFDFEKSKDKFIKLLKKPYDQKYTESYKQFIDILNGKKDTFNNDDILTMISILGRLTQEDQMGPISVMVDAKLNPLTVNQHVENKEYILATLYSLKEYSRIYLSNKDKMKNLGNLGFNKKLDKITKLPQIALKLDFESEKVNSISKSHNEQLIIINSKKISFKKKEVEIDLDEIGLSNVQKESQFVFEPNHMESFFRRLINLFERENVIPLTINNFKDVADELLNFSKRFVNTRLPDFIILAKIKGLLTYFRFGTILNAINTMMIKNSKRKTYYQNVAEYIINIKDRETKISEMYRLVNLYETYIINELSRFRQYLKGNSNTIYNDNEIAIVSDMHFNNLDNIYKGNFSNNFNIIAGDFYNNTYHRSGLPITQSMDIEGVGVIGNHDVSWIKSILDIKKEVKFNYIDSTRVLNQVFPKIKILNNEVIYKNNIAFIGLTIVADERIVNGKIQRSFFGNDDLGNLFVEEDYIETAKKLLDSVEKNIPIVLISHSPFKEYAVCNNKNIGIYSNKFLKDYPNVKLYIHGHGHSNQSAEVVDNILCITNPIASKIYHESIYSIKWDEIIKSIILR